MFTAVLFRSTKRRLHMCHFRLHSSTCQCLSNQRLFLASSTKRSHNCDGNVFAK